MIEVLPGCATNRENLICHIPHTLSLVKLDMAPLCIAVQNLNLNLNFNIKIRDTVQHIIINDVKYMESAI